MPTPRLPNPTRPRHTPHIIPPDRKTSPETMNRLRLTHERHLVPELGLHQTRLPLRRRPRHPLRTQVKQPVLGRFHHRRLRFHLRIAPLPPPKIRIASAKLIDKTTHLSARGRGCSKPRDILVPQHQIIRRRFHPNLPMLPTTLPRAKILLQAQTLANRHKAFQSRLAIDVDGNGISGRYYSSSRRSQFH
jgi:hypothetical protein